VRWMLKLLTPRIVAGSAARRKAIDLDDTVMGKCEKAVIKALRDGKQMTREKICAALERGGILATGPRRYHIFWWLGQQGVICFAKHQGKQPTFALLEEWVPTAPKVEREQALGELARRYFVSHGPATLADFVWWSGLRVSEARSGIAMVASTLAKETVGGIEYWMAENLAEVHGDCDGVHLLPGFDELMLGYRDRGASLDPAHARKIVPGSNGVFMPTIVSAARVVGTWKSGVKKKAVIVTPSLFGKLSGTEDKNFGKAAKRYAEFLRL
jgi:hypothetical protein